ncbi:GumC family protein [Parafilimonas sp.]|uniref:GumC family protein n=1 Tax=Parafilimonas sp. TaxID=1969739 RepID=UPI0039E4790C
MQDSYNDLNVSRNVSPHHDIDVKFLVGKVFGNWYWYALSVFLFLVLATFIFFYTSPYYNVMGRVLVNGYNSQGRQIVGTDQATLLGDLGKNSYPNSVSNELEIIHSRTIIETTMHDLELNLQYFGKNDIRFEEIYKKSPYFIHVLYLNDDKIIEPVEYNVKASDTKVWFEDEDTDSSFTASYGDTLTFWYGSWVLERNPEAEIKNPNRHLGLVINSYHATLKALMDDIEAITTTEYVNIIDLSITAQCPQKNEDMLRHMLNLYVKSDVDNQNRIADSTISFINNRLINVSEDLNNIDKDIETFKKANGITDISDDSKQLLSLSSSVSNNLADKQVQLKVVDDLEKYLLDEHNNTRVMPTTAPIQDAAFVQTLEKYNTLQLQRQGYLQNSTEQNPNVKSIDIQLSQLRGDLLSMMSTFKKGVATEQNELQNRNNQVAGSIKKVPTKERIYIDYTRKQNVVQQLYLYLLQTREQTEVSKSSNIGPIRIIDEVKRGPMPFFPTWVILIPCAVFLGLLVPSVVIFLKELLNTRVITTNDITNATYVPVVADINHNKDRKSIVVSKDGRSQVAEQFRALRTNLHFLLPGVSDKTVLVTSSMGGEGKSFVAVNLAAAIALSGRKALVMELDLRRPHIYSILGANNSEGFSNYILSDINVKDILRPTSLHPDCYYIGPGTLPSNPAELLAHDDRVKQLFDEVRPEFDYIIVDCAPVGLVTDALLLRNYVDTALYVVRQRFTYKKQVNLIQGLANEKKFKNISIVFNDIKRVPGYGYTYGYNNSRGYYSERRSFPGRKKRRSHTA